MTIIVFGVAAITVLSTAGLAYLMHLLRRDRHLIWRPGKPLPDVAADAPLRQWARREHGQGMIC